MKIHLRIDRADEGHTHVAVFINTTFAGRLCMTTEEFDLFAARIEVGLAAPGDLYDQSGNTWADLQRIKSQQRAALGGKRENDR